MFECRYHKIIEVEETYLVFSSVSYLNSLKNGCLISDDF